jgi:copper(I)-binding protein
MVLVSALLFTACKPAEPLTEPVLEDAWIRAAPPGMKMTSAYGTLRNVTETVIDVESFSSPALGHITLHRTEMVDGVSRMQEVEIFSLAPGSSLVMEPGGYHLMIMMPGKPAAVGAQVPLVVHASDGREFSFEVRVEQR